jgi:hypothetical protein
VRVVRVELHDRHVGQAHARHRHLQLQVPYWKLTSWPVADRVCPVELVELRDAMDLVLLGVAEAVEPPGLTPLRLEAVW